MVVYRKRIRAELVLPDGWCDIILRYNDYKSEFPTPIITGPATHPYTVAYEVGDSWLGIRLRPGSGAVVWQQRIDHAMDTVLSGQDAIALLPGLSQMKGGQLNLKNLAGVLAAKKSPLIDQSLLLALDVLHASGGLMQIANIAMYIGCSSRNLNRKFRSNIGVSAKTYAQLVQFHRALKLVQREQLSITDAAFEGGYNEFWIVARNYEPQWVKDKAVELQKYLKEIVS